MTNNIKVLLGPSSFGSLDRAPIELMERNGLTVLPNPFRRKLTREELIVQLQGVGALVAGLESVDREVLESTKLKVISRCGSGVSNVDVAACEALGVVFKYTPFGPTQAVAELTLGMMLALLRQSFDMHASLRQGNWDKRVGSQLKGKTIAIVGYGRIGQRTAELLAPFDVQLIVVDPFLQQVATPARLMTLHEALPQADFVVLHLSGEGQVMGEEEFALIKDGAYLCSAARGHNVDEGALQAALDEGRIAGAWLDSFSTEPYCGPLCESPNVIVTPHIGSYTKEGRLDMEMEAAQNLIDGLAEYKGVS